MSAAAVATGDKNLALILEMGGDREQGYDPIPPDQYLAPLEMEIQLSPSGQKGLAWMRKHTLRAKRCGRTSYAATDGRRALKLSDMATECKFTAPQASRVWRELEECGFVRRDESDRLCLNGRVRPRRNSGEDEELSEAEKFCTDNLPRYLYEQFQRLPENDYHRATTAYFQATKYLKRLKADAIASARDVEEEYLATILASFGITFRRHEREEPAADLLPEEKRPVVKVKFEAIAPPPIPEPVPEKLSVQDFSTDPVQATNPTVYNVENEPVPDSHPYREKYIPNKVSKCEDTGAPEAISGDDLPTPQGEETETETQTPSEPAAPVTIEEKTLPVESGKRTSEPKSTARGASAPQTGEAVAFVERMFGKNALTPKIRSGFDDLAPENGITQAAAARFLFQKWEELLERKYDLRNAGAFLDFAQTDIKLWIAKNRDVLARTAEREAAAAVPPAPMDPKDKLADLERLFADMPTHAQAEQWKQEAAELRAQLGADAPPPYQPETLDEELARLEAQFAELPAGEHANFRRSLKARIIAVRDLLAAELAAALDYVALNPDPDDAKTDQALARIENLQAALKKGKAAGA